ncbi:MAG: bifunctional glutamate N-acetyltransferase/amino-acid acetyltransferase ArgJ [Rubripirellula sp.]|nr:bifunctional glutamate N-acetyltransferase/amino-acid acetyltransferase ArgJ [Rubripirellula sp.]
MSSNVEVEAGPLLPSGFKFAGVACGIKASGKRDLSLIVMDSPGVAAGIYTQNQIVAAPVILCRSRTPGTQIRAVVTNSGNANACTGQQGMQDAETMCGQVAALVGCAAEDVLVMSTGVIGQVLPMDQVQQGIDAAHAHLSSETDAFHNAADAICTTDDRRKIATSHFSVAGKQYRVAAMAKGAGMISPNMATMLAVVMTDAPISKSLALEILQSAANRSFNRVSVDGHTSTNDTMLLLSSGQGDELPREAITAFQNAVDEISIRVAKMLVADGEGASHIMAIQVQGAASDSDAEQIARTVGASPLVKTAITGGDPNWGRIVSAAGYAGAKIDPPNVCLSICGTEIYRNGSPLDYDEAKLSQQMQQSQEVPVLLIVGEGPGVAEFWASDLTTEYVKFNSEYTT